MSGLIPWGSTRWDPFKELEEISNRFNRMFSRLPEYRTTNREALTVADWVPAVNISEDEKEYVIKAELPEVDKKDVKISLEDGVLSIQGERTKEKEEKGKKFHRIESSYGSFFRSFTLPENIAEDKLTADFKDGILLIHLPKAEKLKSKAIEVKVA